MHSISWPPNMQCGSKDFPIWLVTLIWNTHIQLLHHWQAPLLSKTGRKEEIMSSERLLNVTLSAAYVSPVGAFLR